MPSIMINQRLSQYNNTVTRVFKKFYFLITLYVSLSLTNLIMCNAHLIQIDHNEFHSNGFPRTHISPALPPHTPDELPQNLPDKELSPSEYMVDLTNDLAYRILHYHSILNRNNFAFSPTALMSVLIAIYEGSAGRSMTELNNVLHLPNNHDIIRVGYRDIHRRLRTYFFDSDNPLKGLSLNKENVTITRDYETILMFYGYDLGIDMVSSTTVPTTPMVVTTVETAKTVTTLKTSTENIITQTLEIENTTSPVTTTPAKNNSQSSTETPTMAAEIITSTTEKNLTTEMFKERTENITEKRQEESTAHARLPSETPPPTTETAEISTKSETETNEAVELISSFVAEENPEPFSRIQKARVTRLPSAKLQAPLTPKVKSNYLPAPRKSTRLTSRSKRHLFGLQDFDSNLFVTLFNVESQLHSPLTTGSALAGLTTYVQLSNEYGEQTDPNYIASSQSSSNFKQDYNTDVISHVFYLNNKHIIYTTFKVYNAVLYYKYFDHLRSSVLELELDTSEYNLIILLPDYNTDLAAAAAALRAGPKLRLMRKQLRPKWVQAIIPDFKLHGTMFLTNDLQNMGVYDIFEPNRADFRPMTDEKGIYVKHIEQSINVHIRTKPINQLRRSNGAQTQPIQISVNHPFMFFIIDRDLDVAVMTGRILNPLNVRVQ